MVEEIRPDLLEICSILDTAPESAYAVAAKMSWDIRASSWDDFPIAQQWFATGEALSHLRYLEEEKTIRRHLTDKSVLFSLT